MVGHCLFSREKKKQGAFLQWAMHVNRGWGSLSLFHLPSLDWFCVPLLEPWLAFHLNVTFCGETVIRLFLFSLRLKYVWERNGIELKGSKNFFQYVLPEMQIRNLRHAYLKDKQHAHDEI